MRDSACLEESHDGGVVLVLRAGSESWPVSTPCGRKPRSTCWSAAKLRTINPAPVSSTRASDISATTSALRSRALDRDAPDAAAAALLERFLNVGAERVPRRRQAEQQSGGDRDDAR